MTARRRGWRWTLAGVSILLIGGLSTGVYWIRTSRPRPVERVRVNGIAAPVEVLRDKHWVPHIFAQNPEDGAFALGYVHAQDRLWQMESMRRFGAGRLAEIVGDAGLASDRFMRTLGIYRLAEAQVDLLSEDARRTLDAYVAGVNAWIEHRDGALPPEFIALGVEPEPWRPADSLVWIRIMALRLGGNRRTEMLRARLRSRLTDEQIAELWPPYSGDQPVTLERSDGASLDLPSERLAIPEPPALQMPRGASNAWVVDGSQTTTGKPFLANDPHLGFTPYRLGDDQYRQRLRGSVRRTDRPVRPGALSRARRTASVRNPRGSDQGQGERRRRPERTGKPPRTGDIGPRRQAGRGRRRRDGEP
jgi:penicillin amidase